MDITIVRHTSAVWLRHSNILFRPTSSSSWRALFLLHLVSIGIFNHLLKFEACRTLLLYNILKFSPEFVLLFNSIQRLHNYFHFKLVLYRVFYWGKYYCEWRKWRVVDILILITCIYISIVVIWNSVWIQTSLERFCSLFLYWLQ